VRSHQGKVCDGAWHGSCFRQAPQDRYPVLDFQDLGDALVDSEDWGDDNHGRFREARDGDHLMTPFQCVDCHFINIKGRRPDMEDHRDVLAVKAVTRAILDSFWSRESSTVNSNRIEGVRYVRELELLGFQENPYPPRGPFPMEDVWGMRVACAMLERSMSGGRNSKHIQFETVRKLRSHYSNMVHTSAGLSPGEEWYSADRGSEPVLSTAATNSLWFRRFMIGCHRRMGDVWLPDHPLTAPILRQCMILLESKWEDLEGDTVGRWKVGLTACMLLAGYYGALRGEEISRVDLGLILKHWDEAHSHETPHVPLMLKGRFKHVDGEKIFCQPLATRTEAGMDISTWFRRVLDVYEERGVCSGPFFRDSKGGRASVAELDVWFRSILKVLQDLHPNVLSEGADLERFSIRRSARRGATAEAQNSGIPDEIIEANNRWRKRFRSKGMNPRMSMLERYTDAKANVPHLVQFSALLRH
jgi:hypothetical protein